MQAAGLLLMVTHLILIAMLHERGLAVRMRVLEWRAVGYREGEVGIGGLLALAID